MGDCLQDTVSIGITTNSLKKALFSITVGVANIYIKKTKKRCAVSRQNLFIHYFRNAVKVENFNAFFFLLCLEDQSINNSIYFANKNRDIYKTQVSKALVR